MSGALHRAVAMRRDVDASEVRGSGACTHCGDPVRPGAHPADSRFCCAGCAAVWHLLHARHLGHAYELHRREGIRPHQGREPGMQGHLDHEAFQRRHVERMADGSARCEFRVDGIRCGACLWLLESMPRLVPGTNHCRVNLGRGTLEVSWRPEHVPLSTIAGTIESLGYGVRAVGSPSSRSGWRTQDRAWLVRLGVAGAIAGNTMAIAFALYGAQFAWMDSPTRVFLQWVSVGLGAVSVVWPGSIYLRNAWQAMRSRTPHMDLPISVALLAGLLGAAGMTMLGRSGIYVESVSMLVFLLLVGRFVQFRQQRRARHEVELLCALIPQVARRLTPNGAIEDVPTDALCAGDEVLVAAGDALPADGELTSDEAHIDAQLLTGESKPVRRRVGDALQAGTVAVGAPLRLRVVSTGEATRAGHIASAVDRALGERTATIEFANRIAGWFLLAVVAATVVTAVIWWRIDASRLLPVCMALLVVTCPCALGLATPLAIVAGIGKAARSGVLVRGGSVFETMSHAGTMVLDKTGTLTEGVMRVNGVHAVANLPVDASLRLASLLEVGSAHPIGLAIRARAGAVEGRVACVIEKHGQGVAGEVDGHAVRVGSEGWMRCGGLTPSAHACEAAHRAALSGDTPVMIAVDGCVTAVLAIGDAVRRESVETVARLKRRGWRVRLASGDLQPIAQAVGAMVGIAPGDIRGACSPEDKMAWVREQHDRPVVVVGDGVNDLPAMAQADVGVAMRQGAQVTLDRADVAMAGGGLRDIVALVDGSRSVMRTIHVNFAVSLAYNLLGGALAVTGTITPLIAAVLMPLSGLMVTAIALRMPRFEENRR